MLNNIPNLADWIQSSETHMMEEEKPLLQIDL